jgi:hypothetical protein
LIGVIERMLTSCGEDCVTFISDSLSAASFNLHQ